MREYVSISRIERLIQYEDFLLEQEVIIELRGATELLISQYRTATNEEILEKLVDYMKNENNFGSTERGKLAAKRILRALEPPRDIFSEFSQRAHTLLKEAFTYYIAEGVKNVDRET